MDKLDGIYDMSLYGFAVTDRRLGVSNMADTRASSFDMVFYKAEEYRGRCLAFPGSMSHSWAADVPHYIQLYMELHLLELPHSWTIGWNVFYVVIMLSKRMQDVI